MKIRTKLSGSEKLNKVGEIKKLNNKLNSNSLRLQLSKEEMKNISGGKKVKKVTYIQGAVVDCSDDWDPSRCICHERITKTLTYYQNIFGKISNSQISYDGDGVWDYYDLIRNRI